MGRFLSRTAFLLLLAILPTQLSCSAMIALKSGSTIKGRITRSDQSTIYVRPHDSESEFPIARNEIDYIDHPGLSLGILGSVFFFAGTVAMVTIMTSCHGGDDSDCVAVRQGAEIGAPIMAAGGVAALLGWIPYGISVAAAKPGDNHPPVTAANDWISR